MLEGRFRDVILRDPHVGMEHYTRDRCTVEQL